MTPEERLLAYLAINGPAKLDRLAQVLGLPRRECERAVESLRRMGNAIGSGDEGIFLCHTREEGLAHADSPTNLMWRLQNRQAPKPQADERHLTDQLDEPTFTDITLDVKF